MLTRQLASKYARAFFETATEEKKLTEYGKQLLDVTKFLYSQDDLKDFLQNPLLQVKAKKEVLQKILPKKFRSGHVHNFLFLLLDKRRESLLPEICRQYMDLVRKAQNVVQAEVTVAYELGSAQEKNLAAKLSQKTGKTVVITKKIDKSILGGVIVKMGDKCIDGSVRRQMQSLKAQLLGTGAEIGVTE